MGREAETQRAEAELKEKRYLQESAAAEKERQRQQSSDTVELFQKREASLKELDNEPAKPVEQPPPVEEPAATEEQPAAAEEEESVADTSGTSASRSLNDSPEQQDSSAPAKCDSESERLGQIEDRLSSLEGFCIKCFENWRRNCECKPQRA